LILTETRYAIWKAHKKKCVYTGQMIEKLDDLEIDHIIPQSVSTTELKTRTEKYNLSANFSIDSLENLLPTLSRFNKMKWKRPFDESTERFFINIAKSKKINVESELTKFREKVARFESEALKLAIKEKFDFTSPSIYETKREILYRDDLYMTHHYWNSKEKVVLNGLLPSIYDEKGSFAIEFKELPTMISLTHTEIIELLKVRKDGSIKNEIFRGSSYNDSKSFITIGTNAVHLENQLFNDFIEILDDYLSEYQKNYDEFEKFIESNGHKRMENTDYYVLLETTRDKWNTLLEYTKRFDLDKGKGKKYCFNYNGNSVVALDKDYNHIKFWLIPSQIEDTTFESFKSPDNNLNILWRIPSAQDRIRIKSGEIWTMRKTLDWLYETIG
jgi:hypothetical protein